MSNLGGVLIGDIRGCLLVVISSSGSAATRPDWIMDILPAAKSLRWTSARFLRRPQGVRFSSRRQCKHEAHVVSERCWESGCSTRSSSPPGIRETHVTRIFVNRRLNRSLRQYGHRPGLVAQKCDLVGIARICMSFVRWYTTNRLGHEGSAFTPPLGRGCPGETELQSWF